MAFIKFEEKDRPKALMTLFYNRVPFTCHRGFVFDVPEFAVEKLAQSGYAFERLADESHSTAYRLS